jgi:hypothetical protein
MKKEDELKLIQQEEQQQQMNLSDVDLTLYELAND